MILFDKKVVPDLASPRIRNISKLLIFILIIKFKDNLMNYNLYFLK